MALPTYDEATPNLVDAHAWWTVPGKSSAVLAYVKSHLPADAHTYVTSGGNLAPGFASDSFSLRAIRGVLSERVLGVTLVQASESITAVRTDGEAVWIVPRPAWEHLPAAVSRVTFVAGKPSFGTRGSRMQARGRLTGRRARRLVRFINRMALLQPGTRSCPLDNGAFVRLRFLDSSGRLVAHGVEHPTGCATLTLTIGTRTGPTLDDYSSVSSELERLGAIKHGLTGATTARS